MPQRHPSPRHTPDPVAATDWARRLAEHREHRAPRLARLWQYYRNPSVRMPDTGRTLPAQAQGLPARLRRRPDADTPPREIVVENDIAWRIHTLVDFMFGRPVGLRSTAADPDRARRLESLLHAVFEANGGVDFFQNLALLGTIYGHIDVLLRVRPHAAPAPAPGGDIDAIADRLRLETIDPLRAIPALHPHDYRRLEALAISDASSPQADGPRLEVWTDDHHGLLTSIPGGEGLVVSHRSPHALGRVPVVHIQNLPQPFFYEGLSEVEALIPLQDELNTRLSDRANRVTLQSFKMYLGKGIDGFLERSVGPGQMWTTDHPDASIQEFGGDAASPSEEAHIAELREAMDKASGVSPIAAGVVGGKVGNLTSENAIRVVLMGLLARTEKKRTGYGQGVARLCELILHAVDRLGWMPNDPRERGVRLDWPSPIPSDDSQTLRDAAIKREIGVPADRLLAELGYSDAAAPAASQ
mgnify:CR=1 FL=1